MRYNEKPLGATLRRFGRSAPGRAATVGLAVLAAMTVASAFVGGRATVTKVYDANQGASSHHLLGTDALGRDMLWRTIAATWRSLEVAVSVAVLATLVGFLVGVTLGFLPGKARSIGGTALDLILAFPPLFSAIVIISIVGAGFHGLLVGLTLALVPLRARLAFTLASDLADRDFIVLTRASGVSRGRVLLRNVLPNVVDALIITASSTTSVALISAAALSYIGLGIQPPDYDWGRMLIDVQPAFYARPSVIVGPALAIIIGGVTFTLFGDALSRAVDPRSRRVALPRRVANRANRGGAQSDRSSGTQAIADAVVSVRNLRVVVPGESGPTEVVRGVSFDVFPGEVVGLVGESGSGKSLTAMAVAGLLPAGVQASTDQFLMDGVDMTLGGRPGRGRGRVGVVFQDPASSLNPALTVATQLREAIAARGAPTKRAAASSELTEALGDVGIPEPAMRARWRAHRFSGGMKQRIMIAMAMLAHPSLLVADEPTTALDAVNELQILRLLKRISVKRRTAILLISHDLAVIGKVADRILVMYRGTVVEQGPAGEVLSNPRHPYTRALLGSIVTPETDRATRLTTVKAEVFDGSDSTAQGCVFADRCPHPQDVCLRLEPSLLGVTDDVAVACHMAEVRR